MDSSINHYLLVGGVLVLGYAIGQVLERVGAPKLLGYIGVGVLFSPHSVDVVGPGFISTLRPVMEVCLAFIAFEIGGVLKVSKLRKRGKQIVAVTVMASLVPYLLFVGAAVLVSTLFPFVTPWGTEMTIAFALLLGALACPTDPSATLEVMHQYKAKGRSQTLLLA